MVITHRLNFSLSHCKCAFDVAVDNELKEAYFAYGGEVVVVVDERILVFDYCKDVAELEHSREFVLTGTGAVAVADKPRDIFILIKELNIVGFATCNNRSAFALV